MALLRKVGVLALGSGIAQAITVIGMMYLTRIYSPEHFGIYAFALSCIALLSSFSSLRYEMTILIPNRQNSARLALRVAVANSFLVNLTVMLIIAMLVLLQIIASYWIFIPFAAFSYSIVGIFSFLHNRNQEYRKIVGIQILRALLFVLGGVLLSEITLLENGLVGALLISALCPALLLVLLNFRMLNTFGNTFNMRRYVYWIKRNNKFAYFSTPAVFASSLAAQAPVLLLSTMVSPTAAGYYSLINRVVMAPATLISKAVNRVYMQRVAANLSSGYRVGPFTISLLKQFLLPCLLISSTMYIAFYFQGLQLMFGDQWDDIDKLASVMIPALLFGFASKAISGFAVLGKNKLGLFYQLTLLFSVSSAIMLSVKIAPNLIDIFSFISMSLSLCYLGQIFAILKITRGIDQPELGE